MGQDQDGKSNCLCGEQHRYSECNYITPSTRSDGWKGKIAIYKKINKAITSNQRYPNSKKWFQTKFKYDGFKVIGNKPNDNDSEGSQPESSTKSSRDDNTSEGDPKGSNFVTHQEKASRGTFTTYHAFTGTASHKDYKLYDSWTLDSGTDVHVCNNELRSCFTKTREADENEQLFAGKRAYAIECFGTVNVGVNTPDGPDYITLVNVALAPGFMTNLVSLDLLNAKDVHWNSADPTVLRKHSEVFCNLERVGGHWVLERHTTLAAFATSKKARSKPRRNVLTQAHLHKVLAHAGPEEDDHAGSTNQKSTVTDAGLLTPEASPPPSSTQSTAGDTETTEVYLPGAQGNTVLPSSRRSAHITSLEQVKNIQGYHTAFSAALNAIPKKRLYCDIFPLEPKSWKHMLKHLFAKPIKAADYIMNRTPVKALNWKTPHEALTGKPPIYARMHVYGCKAYALNKHIPRFKLDPHWLLGWL